MLNRFNKMFLIKVCKLYYFDSWTQEKIAAKFGVSRPIISKALQKAREEGIVEIVIHDDNYEVLELEETLEKEFGLQEAIVVPTRDIGDEMINSVVGRKAAQYVSKAVRSAKRIGVSWGMTLYHMVKEYSMENREGVKVIPLVGGMGTNKIELHSNQIAYELSKKLNGHCESLYSPAIVESVELRDMLTAVPDIAFVLEEGKQCDVALVGIGNPFANSTMEETGYVNKNELEELKKHGVVGDINSFFIEADGRPSSHSINQRVIGIGLDHLKKIKKVIAIAFGQYKVDSILATLRGGYLNALITDHITAAQLIRNWELLKGQSQTAVSES
jgi:Transcriptional regulator, contains sigma factor-related N-terminal domain